MASFLYHLNILLVYFSSNLKFSHQTLFNIFRTGPTGDLLLCTGKSDGSTEANAHASSGRSRSGNATLASGDALAGQSGTINVRAGRALRRGGDLILTAGHLLRSELNGGGDEGSAGICGSLLLRAGSVEDTASRTHGEKRGSVFGGDVDLAPGTGSEPQTGVRASSRSAHGHIVLRDHTLTPRLIINSRYMMG